MTSSSRLYSKGDNKKPIDVLFYIPNLIGYCRLSLLFLSYLFIVLNNPLVFVILYLLSIILDFFDGWAARKFNQCSSFGAWLDVIVDNVTRSCLWSNLYTWGWIIVSIEWITFVCNHQSGSKWRESLKLSEQFKSEQQPASPTPWFVNRVMENGFKTPVGVFAISGLHVLPVWIYGMQTGLLNVYLPFSIHFLGLIMLITGRLLCLSVEVWCIQKHIQQLLWEDTVDWDAFNCNVPLSNKKISD